MGKKIVGILVAVYITTALLRFAPSEAFAFFDRLTVSDTVTVQIGSWRDTEPLEPFDPNRNYQVGDRFTFNGKTWEVRNLGTTNPPGQGQNLVPYGPYQEVTDN